MATLPKRQRITFEVDTARFFDATGAQDARSLAARFQELALDPLDAKTAIALEVLYGIYVVSCDPAGD